MPDSEQIGHSGHCLMLLLKVINSAADCRVEKHNSETYNFTPAVDYTVANAQFWHLTWSPEGTQRLKIQSTKQDMA